MLIWSTQQHQAAVSGGCCRCHRLGQAGEIVSFLSHRPVYVFFYPKIIFFLMKNESLIETIFKQFKQLFSIGKAHLKCFSVTFLMFLDLGVLWLKQKFKLRKKGLLKSCLRYLIGWIIKASESAKDCGQFHVFGSFGYIFWSVFRGPF